MDSYKSQSFVKLTIRFGLLFLVVVTILKMLISIIGNGSVSGMVEEFFSANTWQPFVKTQLIMSLIYGLLMAGYYKFIKK